MVLRTLLCKHSRWADALLAQVGSEAQGITSNIPHCVGVSIPMAQVQQRRTSFRPAFALAHRLLVQGCESLNAAVAAAVGMWGLWGA
jgi:tRNA G18 (ribose-2'-O)-methylase SpoU